MSKEKSNIDHIKGLLEKLKEHDILNEYGETFVEIEEFLDTTESQIDGLKDDIKNLENEGNSKKEDDDEDEDNPEFYISESVQLGIDKFHWGLSNGNLLVRQQVEHFVGLLRAKHGMIPDKSGVF